MGWVVNATPRPAYPRERSGSHCLRGLMGPRAGLDGVENLASTGIRSPDCPARSQSLYRLSYPGPRGTTYEKKKTFKSYFTDCTTYLQRFFLQICVLNTYVRKYVCTTPCGLITIILLQFSHHLVVRTRFTFPRAIHFEPTENTACLSHGTLIFELQEMWGRISTLSIVYFGDGI
jgi:hypothetical protein